MNKRLLLFCTLMLVSAVTRAQSGEQIRTLVINEQTGKVAVLERGETTYIDLKRLVEIAQGSVAFQDNRIMLDLSCPPDREPLQTAEPEQPSNMRLSREFTKAAIEEISLMREWASTLANAVQNGYPVADNWVAGYHAQAQTGLALSSAAVSTDPDRNAFQLLNREFDHVQAWSNKLLEASKSMNAGKYAVSHDTLQNEPLSQKIVSCAHFLGKMLAGGTFQEDSSCH
jgi:hypothetical protein